MAEEIREIRILGPTNRASSRAKQTLERYDFSIGELQRAG